MEQFGKKYQITQKVKPVFVLKAENVKNVMYICSYLYTYSDKKIFSISSLIKLLQDIALALNVLDWSIHLYSLVTTKKRCKHWSTLYDVIWLSHKLKCLLGVAVVAVAPVVVAGLIPVLNVLQTWRRRFGRRERPHQGGVMEEHDNRQYLILPPAKLETTDSYEFKQLTCGQGKVRAGNASFSVLHLTDLSQNSLSNPKTKVIFHTKSRNWAWRSI